MWMSEIAVTRVIAEEVDAPTPPPSQRRIRLKTIDDVRVEMSRTYVEVRHGKLTPEVGTKLSFMLGQLARLIEGSEMLARVEALEAQEGKKR
jgi:hypothetical protein